MSTARSRVLFSAVMTATLLALAALPAIAGLQRISSGVNAIEGIIIHHARIGQMGILYDVGTFFESFIPVRGATPEMQSRLEAMAIRHAEGETLPASITMNVFVGTYSKDPRGIVVEAIEPARTFRPSDEQVDLVLKFLRARAITTGSEEDRAALDQLIKSGQMREYVFEILTQTEPMRGR